MPMIFFFEKFPLCGQLPANYIKPEIVGGSLHSQEKTLWKMQDFDTFHPKKFHYSGMMWRASYDFLHTMPEEWKFLDEKISQPRIFRCVFIEIAVIPPCNIRVKLRQWDWFLALLTLLTTIIGYNIARHTYLLDE